MEYDRALSQISDIHDHLASVEVYRGFRALPVALSGVSALAAAALQNYFIESSRPGGFILYWSVVAILNVVMTTALTAQAYFFRESQTERRRTRRVVSQFLPCIGAGVLLTVLLPGVNGTNAALLPGIWAVVFGLGIFSIRPYLPRATGWAGLFYLFGGAELFVLASSAQSFSPWGIGTVFGVGQLIIALILYWNIERNYVEK